MFAASGRAQIAYDVTAAPGDAAGADVVLIHAGVTDRRSWAPLVDRLAPQHRCVTFDARCYGETVYEPEEGWSRVADTIAVMDAAGIDRAVVVACSMGGATALELTLTHPERVSALVLIGAAINGAPYPDVTEEPTASINAQVEAAEEAEEFDEVNRLEAWLWLDGPNAPEGRVGGPRRELFLEMNDRALRSPDPGSQAERVDAWSRLGEIAVPTLVLVGRLDVADIAAVDEQLAGIVPDARLVWLDGVAHLPHFEADEACLREVSAFIADR